MKLSTAEFYALACAVLWATNALLLRTLARDTAPATINAVRCGSAGVAFLLLMPFTSPLAGLLAVPWMEWGLLLLSLTSGLVIGDTLYLVALRDIGVSRAMPVSGTFPLSTLPFERLLLGTPLQPSLLAGSLLVGGGVVLMAWGRTPERGSNIPSSRLLRGVVCALAASLLWGLAVTMFKPATASLTMVQANAMRMPVVALLLYCFVLRPSSQRPLRALSRRLWVLLVASGLTGMGLGGYLFLTAMSEIGPAKAVTLTSSSPVIGIALAVLFLKEKLDARAVLGTGCCLLGVYTVL